MRPQGGPNFEENKFPKLTKTFLKSGRGRVWMVCDRVRTPLPQFPIRTFSATLRRRHRHLNEICPNWGIRWGPL